MFEYQISCKTIVRSQCELKNEDVPKIINSFGKTLKWTVNEVDQKQKNTFPLEDKVDLIFQKVKNKNMKQMTFDFMRDFSE